MVYLTGKCQNKTECFWAGSFPTWNIQLGSAPWSGGGGGGGGRNSHIILRNRATCQKF